MSDAKASSPPSSSPAAAVAAPSAALPGSERPDYRGKCLYKTGKCTNERALKTSGAAHNLCDEHRNRQNQHQRKLDAKNRLHKRERRPSVGGASSAKSERFAPYRTAAAADKRQSLPTSVETSDEADSLDNVAAVVASDAAPAAPPAAATTVEEEGAMASPATVKTPVLATASSGVMFLPNGPQPPHVSYPFLMQDFDGIVVPLPSYLEGQERIEFRSRIYQKVLDFISEECILRFGAKVESAAVDAAAPGASGGTASTTQTSLSGLETEHPAGSETNAPTPSEEHVVNDMSDAVTDESRTTSSTTKKVH
ncbi:hypothetical protein PHYPSEUDO_008277 [Phytophthora pseudosyringae]|uniref:Uncharacterized protein n=1 Tax=Phytophthora pseudosyringae TaxID=221518 RepID=A0A8T1VEE4_9STRA|nr:hypothetical protein PHYPSEUDO_008277 [Phytophthora pseudosyringae]